MSVHDCYIDAFVRQREYHAAKKIECEKTLVELRAELIRIDEALALRKPGTIRRLTMHQKHWHGFIQKTLSAIRYHAEWEDEKKAVQHFYQSMST